MTSNIFLRRVYEFYEFYCSQNIEISEIKVRRNQEGVRRSNHGYFKPVIDYELEAEFIGKGQILNCGQVTVKVQARQ